MTTSFLEHMVGTVLCVRLNRSDSVQRKLGNVVVPSSSLKFSPSWYRPRWPLRVFCAAREPLDLIR